MTGRDGVGPVSGGPGSGRVGDDDEVDLAVDVALDALDADERSVLEQRLDGARPEVRRRFEAEVRRFRETLAATTGAIVADPPAGLRARVLDAVGREAPGAIPVGGDGSAEAAHAEAAPAESAPAEAAPAESAPAESARAGSAAPTTPTPIDRGRRRPAGTRLLAAAAAVAVLFGSGLAVGRITAPDAPPVPDSSSSPGGRAGSPGGQAGSPDGQAGERIRALLAAEDLRMLQEDVAEGGQVSVMYAPSVRMGTVVVTGAGAPPPGHHMTVWHAHPDSTPRPAATMGGPNSDAPGSAMLTDLDAGDVLMLTMERDGAQAPAEPAGAVLAQIDLR